MSKRSRIPHQMKVTVIKVDLPHLKKILRKYFIIDHGVFYNWI